MNRESRIFVAGHKGMVGSAVLGMLKAKGYENLLTRSSKELDLREQTAVRNFFQNEKPEYVFLAAAKVGGILANSEAKAEFFYDNAMIALNVIHSAFESGVKKLVNLGSSCIYPKMAPQPLKEDYLLTGPLEPTNEGYAVAKIAAIKQCGFYNQQYGTDFISVMPTNLYGYNDNFDLTSSHVLPAMIRKFHDAVESGGSVTLWGDGTPMREFLFADDLAEAVIFLMENYKASDIGELVNIGTGKDITIKKLAELILDVVGYNGDIVWDTSKPNGTPRKVLDVSKINNLGWKASTELKEGIDKTYVWFLENRSGAE
jgi:GDP-L-fucose synthase